jgi:hypothetical protein
MSIPVSRLIRESPADQRWSSSYVDGHASSRSSSWVMLDERRDTLRRPDQLVSLQLRHEVLVLLFIWRRSMSARISHAAPTTSCPTHCHRVGRG